MMDMVERVALAIYNSNDPTRDDPLCVTLHHSDFIEGETVEAQLKEVMSICRSAALAAIAAMREVSDEFLEEISARMWTDETSDNFETWPYQRTVIRAFVDAALAGTQP